MLSAYAKSAVDIMSLPSPAKLCARLCRRRCRRSRRCDWTTRSSKPLSERYYELLTEVRVSGDWEAWLGFFSMACAMSARANP